MRHARIAFKASFSVLSCALLAALWAALTGCGYVCDKTKTFCKAEKEEEAPVLASMEMTISDQSPAGSTNFMTATTCDLDSDRGVLVVAFQQGSSELNMEIRDFSSTPRSYTCAQAGNNNDAVTNVGDLYETCMLEAKAPNPTLKTVDVYAMHRASTSVKRFTYDGACTIEVDAATGHLSGGYSCTNMAQTVYGGIARNPVASDNLHADTTANIAGTFGCDLRAKAIDTGTVPPPPPPASANMTVTASDGSGGTTSLAQIAQCSLDTGTGLLHAAFSSGSQSMVVEVRNFASAAATHTCTQAADNASDATSVGDFYEGCMVDVHTRSGIVGTPIDGYSIYRAAVDVKRFAYDGVCTVKTSEAQDQVTGTVSCTKMAQTSYHGAPRNPVATDNVHADVTADVSADFKCEMLRN